MYVDPNRAAHDAITAAGLTIGTHQNGERHTASTRTYTGVLRRGTQVVADCGHLHANRDQSSRTGGTSATDCIRLLVRAAVRPAFADYEANEIATRWMRLGPYATTSMREQVKADAPTEVVAYRAKVAQIADLLGGAE